MKSITTAGHPIPTTNRVRCTISTVTPPAKIIERIPLRDVAKAIEMSANTRNPIRSFFGLTWSCVVITE